MGLISQDIQSFKGGVSQQPPIIRFPDQLEEQINGFSSEVYGLQKRPPLVGAEVLADNLTTATKESLKNAKWHFINRDDNERYIVQITNGDLAVYDLEGNKKTVNFPNGKTYLNCGTSLPENTFKCVTVADYTFIVNNTKKVAMLDDISEGGWENCTLYWVKTSNYGRVFSIRINGEEIANMITADGGEAKQALWATTDIVARALWKSMNGDSDDPSGGYPKTDATYNTWVGVSGTSEWGYTSWSAGSPLPDTSWNRGLLGSSVLYIQKKDRSTFTTDIRDGYGGQSMILVRNEVDNINKLPTIAPEGYILRIKGRQSSGTDDDYYVKWDSSKSVWAECVAPNIPYKIDNSTMPWGLVREADGSFTFKTLTWDERKSGDEDTNPDPSFIGQTISDVFFFRNRLGFVSGENIILSESSNFFNFWFKSAAVLADTDTIDVAVSDNKVVDLTHAIPYSRELILFSREGQFVLSSDGTMSPKSVKCDKITGFTYAPNVSPVNVGSNIFFFNTRSEFGSLMRFYTIQDGTENKEAIDVSSHVPSYIPKNIKRLSGNTTYDLILLANKSRYVYTYKYILQAGQELQQSWSKWDFGEKAEVLCAEMIDDTIYFVLFYGGLLVLSKANLKNNIVDFSDEPFRLFIDFKEKVSNVGTYNDYTGNTTIHLEDVLSWRNHSTYTFPTGESGEGWVLVDSEGQYYEIDPTDGAILDGDRTNEMFFIGRVITSTYQLSTIKIKTGSSSGSVASENEGRLQLRYFWVNYTESGLFSIFVKDIGRNQTYKYVCTSKIASKYDNLLGLATLHSGKFKFPVQRNTDDVTITISDSSPQPLTIVSGGWEGLYVRRNQKV